MKHFLLLLALSGAYVFATVNQKFTYDFGNLNAQLPSSSSGPIVAVPTDADGKPMSPAKAAFIERMNAARAPKRAHWSDDYEVVCESQPSGLSFEGEIYPIESLDPEKMGPGIAWAAKDIDDFFTGPYPGGFTADEREMRLIKVNWEALNEKVRKWIEVDREQRSFLMKDGVCFFAPGTVLEFLPLFVDGGVCGGAFDDLKRYGKDFEGERVSGGIMAKVEIGNSITLQLKAEKMVRKGMGGGKDEL